MVSSGAYKELVERANLVYTLLFCCKRRCHVPWIVVRMLLWHTTTCPRHLTLSGQMAFSTSYILWELKAGCGVCFTEHILGSNVGSELVGLCRIGMKWDAESIKVDSSHW